jgi:long-chain acyl-CoA synthetase
MRLNSASPLMILLYILISLDIANGFRVMSASKKWGTSSHTSEVHSILNIPRMALSQSLHMSCVDTIDIKQGSYEIVPDLFDVAAREVPNNRMLIDPIHGDNVELSYSQFFDLATAGAASMQSLGLGVGDCVSIFAENSYRWLVLDQSVMKAGGHNSVRGVGAPLDELNYIYDNSKSSGLVVENVDLLKKMSESSEWVVKPKFVVVLWDDKKGDAAAAERGSEIAASLGAKFDGVKIMTYEEFILAGEKDKYVPVPGVTGENTATILYTSGTTSKPKGVVLSHRNLLHQVESNTFSVTAPKDWNPVVGDTVVSILPCWHIYERTSEYFCFARGVQQIYSNLGSFKSDLAHWRPHFLFAVPRLFETIHKGALKNFRAQSAGKQKLIAAFTAISCLYKRALCVATNKTVNPSGKTNPAARLAAALASVVLFPFFKVADTLVWKKVREGLGGRLKVATSGGSLLPMHIETFFRMIGLNIIVGYGLTESSPIICSRMVEHNVIGTVGQAGVDTHVKVVDPDSQGEVLKPGEVGLLKARGPSVLQKYNDDPAATVAAIDSEGYFDTGDLGRQDTATGQYVITGRFKDTIVLSNGENVAPQPIEDRITGVSGGVVDQAMLVGQDQPFLAAVAVLNPSALCARGLISPEWAAELEVCIGATPLTTGPAGDMSMLLEASEKLRSDSRIMAAVAADLEAANAGTGRPWEKVGKAVVTLVPLSVSNNQLTQTLKIKRDVVAAAFASEISAVYLKK